MDDPATPMAEAKSSPAFHQMMSPKPSIKRQSHSPNRRTMDAGPTNDRMRSRKR